MHSSELLSLSVSRGCRRPYASTTPQHVLPRRTLAPRLYATACVFLCLAPSVRVTALWDHTQNVQDVDHEERGHSMSGKPSFSNVWTAVSSTQSSSAASGLDCSRRGWVNRCGIGHTGAGCPRCQQQNRIGVLSLCTSLGMTPIPALSHSVTSQGGRPPCTYNTGKMSSYAGTAIMSGRSVLLEPLPSDLVITGGSSDRNHPIKVCMLYVAR